MYTPTIGLEVHAELKTKSKMFCGCANDPHASAPNSNICPICMGHPGTLPVPNKEAVKSVLVFGTAVDGELANFSEFDRKNYFYPDIPKAYQLSQYAFPFVKGGELAGVKLTRVHLEEDTARSQHDKGDYSLVDYNRAGVPLMELVTEPVIHDAETAGKFAKELQLLLRTLGISEANMEKGEMRVEANISVSNSGQLGTKVEVKNLNSFRSVESAIKYEIARQVELLESGEVIHQETRGWDEAKQSTYVQRSKETAKDYRYFPDPDIPKLEISKIDDFSKSRLAELVPALPREKREKYSLLGLSADQIETIISNQLLNQYFEVVTESEPGNLKKIQLSVNYLLTDLSQLIKDRALAECLPPIQFSNLISLYLEGKLNSRVVKDMLIEFALDPNVDVEIVVKDRGLLIIEDASAIEALINKILENNPAVVEEYKAGKVSVLQYLVGQSMKESRGSANPETIRQAILAKIG